jgi:hypothetical protein
VQELRDHGRLKTKYSAQLGSFAQVAGTTQVLVRLPPLSSGSASFGTSTASPGFSKAQSLAARDGLASGEVRLREPEIGFPR